VSRRGWVLFLTMSVIWGIPYLLIKVAVDEVSPVMLVFARCVVGAALLLPWTIAKGLLRPALRHWRALLLFTVLEMAGPWLLIAYAEESLSSSLTGLLVAGVPFVAALAGLLLGEEERLTPIRVLGMAIGVVGIGVLLGLDLEGAQLLPILAIGLVLIGYATGPLVVTRALPDVSGVAASSIALFVTAVVYAPFAAPQLDDAASAPATAWLALVALGVVCTALALALFFSLIREVGPQRALVITFVNPAVAVVLGAVVLNEEITPLTVGAFALILAGSYLATRRRPAPAPAPEAEPAPVSS